MDSLRTVYLHGSLRRFGRSFTLAVSTPAEVIRALSMQLPGFKEAVADGWFRIVTGARGRRRDRADDDLHAGFSQAMHLIPVVAGAGGAKGAAVGAIIGGALLIAAAFVPVLAIGGSFAAATVFGVSSSTVALMGAGAVLYGTSALLAPKPALQGGTSVPGSTGGDTTRQNSFIFGGAPDRPIAGRPVQVGFGTFRVPCAVISLQIKNVRIA